MKMKHREIHLHEHPNMTVINEVPCLYAEWEMIKSDCAHSSGIVFEFSTESGIVATEESIKIFADRLRGEGKTEEEINRYFIKLRLEAYEFQRYAVKKRVSEMNKRNVPTRHAS